MLNLNAALHQRARDQPVTVALFVIGFGAHKSHRLRFSQFEQPLNSIQVEARERQLFVIHAPAFEVKLFRFGATAEFISKKDVFDAAFTQALLQRFAAEVQIVTAIGFAARVNEHNDLIAPE